MAGLFQVLYGRQDGTFAKAEALKGTDGEPLIIVPLDGQTEKSYKEQICTRPFAVDWDGDGHLDLVVGNFMGAFYWFKGEGEGKFRPKPDAITSGGEQLRVDGFHGDPFVIDWDGDGDLDLLSGSGEGGVQWAENTVAKGRLPDLRSFRSLIKPGRYSARGKPVDENDLTGPANSTRVWAADVNADGKPDLLVGDSVTLFKPADGLKAKEIQREFAAWQDAYDAASSELQKATEESERARLIEQINKLYEHRAEFVAQSGFVWLYLHK